MSLSGGGGGEKPTRSELELAKIADEKWKFRQKVYKPVENAYLQKIKNLGSPIERQRAAAKAAATSSINRGLPTGDFSDIVAGEREGAAGLGLQLAQSDVMTKSRENKGKESAIAIGKDIENIGVGGISRQASNESIRQMGETQADATRDSAVSDLVGTGVGYGIYRNMNPKDPPDPEIDFNNPLSAGSYMPGGVRYS